MNIELEILLASHQEHFKFAKDLALILPLAHPKRLRIEAEVNKLVAEIENVRQSKTG